jgi:hypothetical protein
MRLRNPGNIARAVSSVNQVKDELGSASTQGQSPLARADAFLTWCDSWGTPQLGNHFLAHESIFAELTDSYHRISALQFAAMPVRQANGIMNREFREWDTRLDRLLGKLSEMAAFLGHPGRVVVLDTSALMEGIFSLSSTGISSIPHCRQPPSDWSCRHW